MSGIRVMRREQGNETGRSKWDMSRVTRRGRVIGGEKGNETGGG
jgi:hypothetical protein